MSKKNGRARKQTDGEIIWGKRGGWFSNPGSQFKCWNTSLHELYAVPNPVSPNLIYDYISRSNKMEHGSSKLSLAILLCL